MEALYGFLAFFAIALIGWAIAELKAKADNYVSTEQEDAAMQAYLDGQKKNGYTEQSIRDVIKSIATKGFSAI